MTCPLRPYAEAIAKRVRSPMFGPKTAADVMSTFTDTIRNLDEVAATSFAQREQNDAAIRQLRAVNKGPADEAMQAQRLAFKLRELTS